jgi:PAS domain S-box-containing protein
VTTQRTDNPVPARQPLRVLILEDNSRDAELLAATLRRAGYSLNVEVTDSREQFRQRLEQGDLDVILADYNLRTWTAVDALEVLKKSAKDVPFLVVTGSVGDEAAVECIKQGAADYVLKDRLQRLPVVVETALREKAHREEALRLQEDIRRAKKEWEVTFDTVPDAVLLVDKQFRIQRANRAAAALLGLEPAQLIGQRCHEAVHGLAEPLAGCPYQRMLASGREERGDIEEPRLGKIFDVTATPLRDSQGVLRGCVHVSRDVTRRKQLEEQLRQAQKMEAIGRLAGGVAHDFNNLLTIIAGYGQILLDRLGPDDHLRGHVREIEKAANRAASLTRQLLAFGRRQMLSLQVLDLNAVVANMDRMLRRLIGEDIDLVTVCGEGLGRVKADLGQLEQVILNLALNARDAMPRGGKLTLETANAVLDETYARTHMDVTPGHYVMLAVSDSGCGMDAETKAHIFEPFFTTKEQGKGTGLGLATVYGIVKQSGGCIWVYSEPGRSTTFKIYLPRVDGDTEEAVEREKEPTVTVQGSETILLVEDEAEVRSLVRGVLESKGYTVLEARDGALALQIAEQHQGPIHLLLTDAVMPEMSGRELAEHLETVHRETKVLYMSGYTDNAIVHHGALEPGTAFLQKPFAPDALARKVREVLDGARQQPA